MANEGGCVVLTASVMLCIEQSQTRELFFTVLYISTVHSKALQYTKARIRQKIHTPY